MTDFEVEYVGQAAEAARALPGAVRSRIEARLREGARAAMAAGLAPGTTRIALEGWGLTLRFEPARGLVQVLTLHPVLGAS